MVLSASQLATIFLLAFGASSVVAAPVTLLNPGDLVTSDGKPVYKLEPVFPSKRADEPQVNTRSSKYAIDYLPTWAISGASAEATPIPIAEKAAPVLVNTRTSKYAIDYLASRLVEAPQPSATDVEEATEEPLPATKSSKYAIDYLPSWAVKAESSADVEETEQPVPLATRSSKYAIDYHPTAWAAAPKETADADLQKSVDASFPEPSSEPL